MLPAQLCQVSSKSTLQHRSVSWLAGFQKKAVPSWIWACNQFSKQPTSLFRGPLPRNLHSPPKKGRQIAGKNRKINPNTMPANVRKANHSISKRMKERLFRSPRTSSRLEHRKGWRPAVVRMVLRLVHPSCSHQLCPSNQESLRVQAS